MLAVAVSARAPTADPRIEVTLSPRLRTAPLPVRPAGVADRWRNIGSCQKPPWQTHDRSRRCHESHADGHRTSLTRNVSYDPGAGSLNDSAVRRGDVSVGRAAMRPGIRP